MKNDKFNGNYMYGEFPNVTVKSNFMEYFISDYYNGLHDINTCYFVTRIIARKVEFGLIGGGYYVSFTNRFKEPIEHYANRVYNTNSIVRLQNSKNTPEEFQLMLESFEELK